MLLKNFLEGSRSLRAADTCFLLPRWENCPFAALPLQLRLCKNPHVVWKYRSNLNRDSRKSLSAQPPTSAPGAAPPCLFQDCHRPSPAPCLHLPALGGQEGGRAQLCPCLHHHRSLPLSSEPIYFTQAQEGCSGPRPSWPARSHHQTPSRSFVHPSPGFQHVLMLQITWQTPKRLQTLPGPFKREQQPCWECHEHCHLLVHMSEQGGLRWC